MIRIFRVSIPVGVLALLLSEIILTSICFVAAAFIVLGADGGTYFLDETGLIRTLLVITSIIVGLHFMDLYTHIHVKSRMRLLQDLCQVIGIALLVQGLIAYTDPYLRLGRGIMLVGTLISLVVLFAWRVFYAKFILDAVVVSERLLFVGSNQVVEEMADHIMTHPELGLAILGYLANGLAVETPLKGGRVLGAVGDLRRVATQMQPTRIVVGMTERRDRMPVPDLLELRFAGYAIEEAGATYEAVCGRICTKELRPSQLIFSGELGPRPGSLAIQNLLNISVVLICLAISLPIMVLVALLIKLTSRGPVLYRQTRVGKNGSTFKVYKFRSMRTDAEATTGAVWASKDDPRITPLGKWLRRLRLDELPQFFNVLRGEMSLVGPRPERPEFVKILSEQIPYYRQRHCVKPGITGWAQINYKYGDTLEDTVTKLEYDLYYIKHISPSLDLYIIFHTLKTMLLQRGSQ
jgi:sugar transferase (PEP-CTERM system associated)